MKSAKLSNTIYLHKCFIQCSGYNTKEEMLEVVASGVSGIKADDAKAAIDQLVVDKDGKVSYPE